MKQKIGKLCTVLLILSLSSFLLQGCKGNDRRELENPTSQYSAVEGVDTTVEPVKTKKDAESGKPEHEIKDVKVKALYLTGWTVGSNAKLQHYVELANRTEINSYVIDIKDEDGYVGYETELEAVKEIGAWKKKYDVNNVIEILHDNGIHVIGRIVCFKDPVLSSKKPDLAVKRTNGELWREKGKTTWLNPYNEDSWPYLIDLAKEAVELGFDEIQFDYVRFPTEKDKTAINWGDTDKPKHEAINEFLSYAKKEITNVKVSADVFGIICESQADREDIGQYLEYVGKEVDYISPMVYPSHYATGQIVNGIAFPKPDLEPYKVVYNSIIKAKRRISEVEGYKADIRPYLQDFTASWLARGTYQVYGAEQVRQQIDAVYDAGYSEWILWNAKNTYSESALLKENN
jgi:hypothetical protein